MKQENLYTFFTVGTQASLMVSSRLSSPQISLVKGERYLRELKKTQDTVIQSIMRKSDFLSCFTSHFSIVLF